MPEHAQGAAAQRNDFPMITDPEDGLNFGGLRHNTGFLLRMAWLQVRETLGNGDGTLCLSAAEFTILQVIAQTPGVRQGQLARALYIKPAAMTRLIRGFEDRGLVMRIIPPKNRRTVMLSVRPAGLAALDMARAFYSASSPHERGGLTATEQQELNRLLRKYCGIGPTAETALTTSATSAG
ncbi:MarR family winged helix-turn-helix transcriptional regulator [Roseinatronobacter alkalisoli]|uniref:MarR family winged helix-turn-helix transcriptional regulator n=1 Tax=Roseinatronobacter alkalisoli TaxID=3028235 RepID=A0ABT5TBD6_9RHOB|nr:MarR family winged helix-turn-helix transcriptional regulator [Roseinatronobacter sp. HJB301]MDD7972430.1 MarR family winged helix-turn-helix transcriptional regulator [Roseinatronobacter sp. HJB301]